MTNKMDDNELVELIERVDRQRASEHRRCDQGCAAKASRRAAGRASGRAEAVRVTLPLSHSLWQGSFGFVTDSLSGSRCVMANLLTHVVVNAGCLAASRPHETFPPPPRAPT